MKNIRPSSFFANANEQHDYEADLCMQIYLESTRLPSIGFLISIGGLALLMAGVLSVLIHNVIPITLMAGVLMGMLYCRFSQH